jgi:hypothetical protein
VNDVTEQPDDHTHNLADNARAGLEAGGAMRRATAVVDRADTLSRQNDLLSGVVAHLMNKHGYTTLVLGSFELECGPRVSIRPDAVTKDSQDKNYYIECRPGKAGS